MLECRKFFRFPRACTECGSGSSMVAECKARHSTGAVRCRGARLQTRGLDFSQAIALRSSILLSLPRDVVADR